MAVSIKEVAKHAGVAISTVSKVINNYHGISEETRTKVNQAIDELNYSPHILASSLSSKQSNRVALVTFINNQRQAIDEINMLYLYGAFNRGSEAKMDVVAVLSSVIENMDEKELSDYFQARGISALVIYGLTKENEAFLKLIESQMFKVVMVDAPIVNETTSSVMVDHRKAQYEVAKQTLEKASKTDNVLYLAGRKDGWVTDLRLQGVLDLQAEQGFNLKVVYADFSEAKAMEATINFGRDADVVVCASDLMAIGAVKGLRKLDVFHPVCGYDGITLLGYMEWEILTVVQDFYRLSMEAIDQIRYLLSGNNGRTVLKDFEIRTINHEDIIT